MKLMSSFSKFFIVVMLLFVTTVHAEDKTITFGVYTSDKPTVMHKKFKPIIDYLQLL